MSENVRHVVASAPQYHDASALVAGFPALLVGQPACFAQLGVIRAVLLAVMIRVLAESTRECPTVGADSSVGARLDSAREDELATSAIAAVGSVGGGMDDAGEVEGGELFGG